MIMTTHPDECRFQLSDGRIVFIMIDDDGGDVEVLTADGEMIGSFEFHQIEIGDDLSHGEDVFFLANAFLISVPGYLNCGIGTEVLRRWTEMFQDVPYVEADDGVVGNSGGHLTGSGPGFANAMVRKGLLRRQYRADLDE